MTSYLGPETPRPFAVISEKYQPLIPPLSARRSKPVSGDSSDFLQSGPPVIQDGQVVYPVSQDSAYMSSEHHFGATYLNHLCEVIQRYGEVCVNERLCYVGPERGEISHLMEERFQLSHPVQHVTVGPVSQHQLPDSSRNMAVTKITIGAEEYFQEAGDETLATLMPIYDKIIVRDALEYLEDRDKFFCNAMATLHEDGYMLILHRPQRFITLPYYKEALEKVKLIDLDANTIIQELFKQRMEVEWESEILPAVVAREKWLHLLHEKYPNHLELLPPCDAVNGMRELCEGCMKYMPSEEMEMKDRLLVIRVRHRRGQDDPLPPRRMSYMKVDWSALSVDFSNMTTSRRQQKSAQKRTPASDRSGTKPQPALRLPNIIRLPITEDIRKAIPQSVRNRRPNTARPEWFGTVSENTLQLFRGSRFPARRLNRYV